MSSGCIPPGPSHCAGLETSGDPRQACRPLLLGEPPNPSASAQWPKSAFKRSVPDADSALIPPCSARARQLRRVTTRIRTFLCRPFNEGNRPAKEHVVPSTWRVSGRSFANRQTRVQRVPGSR